MRGGNLDSAEQNEPVSSSQISRVILQKISIPEKEMDVFMTLSGLRISDWLPSQSYPIRVYTRPTFCWGHLSSAEMPLIKAELKREKREEVYEEDEMQISANWLFARRAALILVAQKRL